LFKTDLGYVFILFVAIVGQEPAVLSFSLSETQKVLYSTINNVPAAMAVFVIGVRFGWWSSWLIVFLMIVGYVGYMWEMIIYHDNPSWSW
jgi:hypothetical protein